MIKKPWFKFTVAFFYLSISYYICVLLHEWGHGIVAWLFGVKEAFYDVQYGGWLMLETDENVPYNQLLSEGRGVVAALIGIAGLSMSLSLLLLSLFLMHKIRNHPFTYLFFYWIAVVNMIPLVQYLSVQTFTSTGDVGRFTHGLNLSPWWIFPPGVLFIAFTLYIILARALPKTYALLQIRSLYGQILLLATSLSVMFLWIYSHGYNPFRDRGGGEANLFLAFISISLVPLLFFICYPSRKWVKGEVERQQKALSN